MKNMFAQTERICAGRFVLDVPQNTQLTLDARYFGVLAQPSIGRADFDHVSQSVQKRADALKTEMMDASLQASYSAFKDLASTTISPSRLVQIEKDPATNSMFLAYHKSTTDAALIVEQHKVIQQQHFIFTLEGGLSADDYPARKARILEASQSFVPRSAREIPKQAGFCVDGGFYSGSGQSNSLERFTLTLKFPAAPDVSVSLDSSVLDKKSEEPSLLQRLAQRSPGLAGQIPGFRILRQGHPSYAGLPGEEVLSSARNEGLSGGIQHQFRWESAGVPGNAIKPALEAEMNTGQNVDSLPRQSSFGDDEAVEFWEKLLRSLQERQAAN